MAEYRALAQNTLKIVTEVTLHHNGEIGVPTVPNYPRIKHISEDRSTVQYHNLTPTQTKEWTKETCVSGKIHWTVCPSAAASGYSSGPIHSVLFSILNPLPSTNVELDGKLYYGQKSAVYAGSATAKSAGAKGIDFTIPANGWLPGGTARVAIYTAAGGGIVTEEKIFPAAEIGSYTVNNSDRDLIAFAASYPALSIKKETNDIVLAIEIEYPKHDITISGTGLQYSTDDGLTFQDVTDGLVLEQIEHVIFKNTGEVAVNVGTTEGGSDVGSIAAGATYVAVPEANGTWYIS